MKFNGCYIDAVIIIIQRNCYYTARACARANLFWNSKETGVVSAASVVTRRATDFPSFRLTGLLQSATGFSYESPPKTCAETVSRGKRNTRKMKDEAVLPDGCRWTGFIRESQHQRATGILGFPFERDLRRSRRRFSSEPARSPQRCALVKSPAVRALSRLSLNDSSGLAETIDLGSRENQRHQRV